MGNISIKLNPPGTINSSNISIETIKAISKIFEGSSVFYDSTSGVINVASYPYTVYTGNGLPNNTFGGNNDLFISLPSNNFYKYNNGWSLLNLSIGVYSACSDVQHNIPGPGLNHLIPFNLNGLGVVGPIFPDTINNTKVPLTANAVNIINMTDPGSFLLPPAIAGTIVVILLWQNPNSNVSIFSAEGDSLNSYQGDFLDYLPVVNNQNPNGVLFIVCPTNGVWYTPAAAD